MSHRKHAVLTEEEVVERVTQLVREAFNDSPPSHDWSHTERVLHTCLRLAAKEGGDPYVLRLAALLHDVARDEEYASPEVCHALASAKRARRVLGDLGVPAETVASVAHCIEAHRYRNTVEPESIEAQILHDADKLDALGAVGVARAYLWLGEFGRGLYDEVGEDTDPLDNRPEKDSLQREWVVKLRHLKDRMYTATAHQWAEQRHQYMAGYIKMLEEEVKGRA